MIIQNKSQEILQIIGLLEIKQEKSDAQQRDDRRDKAFGSIHGRPKQSFVQSFPGKAGHIILGG